MNILIMHSRFSQSSVDFVVATILFVVSFILMAIGIGTAFTVYNNSSLSNDSNSSFFQIISQDYRKIPREVDVKPLLHEQDTFTYWLIYSDNKQFYIVESVQEQKPVIGTNILKKQLNSATKNITSEVINDARLMSSDVSNNTQIYSLSSVDEYQKSWLSYIISACLVASAGAVFLFSGFVSKRKNIKNKDLSQTKK